MKTLKQIEEAFSNPDLYEDEPWRLRIDVSKSKRGATIRISAMYSAPKLKVQSLLELVQLFAALCDVTNVDIIDEFAQSGCETCDYGSSYGKVYEVW